MVNQPKVIKPQKHKIKLPEQNYGKGRPKKKEIKQEEHQVERHWFNVKRAFDLFTYICEKGSLALRYKTGQRTSQTDEILRKRKSDETRHLKNKLRELKALCNYDDKLQYLLIQDNNSPPLVLDIEENLLSDVNLIYKYLSSGFQVSFVVILQVNNSDDPIEQKVKDIVDLINQQPAVHKMILDLALIRINIDDDLEHVLKMEANEFQLEYVVDGKYYVNEEKQQKWLKDFVYGILKLL